MRLALEDAFTELAGRFEEARDRFPGYRADMLAHPIAGPSLRNYLILSECPEWLGGLRLSEAERFWSRYYWLARFEREWHAAIGYDAGLQQQVFQLLESAENIPITYDPLPEVQAAVERDAALPPRG